MNTLRLLFSISFFTLPYFTIGQNTLTTIKYEYDYNNQLTKTIYSSGKTYTYIYDEIGNRKQKIISISCVLPTAFLSGSTTIEEGQSTSLKFAYAGTKPINMTVNEVTFSYINSNNLSYEVTPGSTQTYTISQISNACGLGTAHGSATVTVVPRVLRPDIIIESFDINQYTENEIMFSIKIKNIGEKPANMENFNLKSFVSPNPNLQQVGGFNNSWTMSSVPELGIGEDITLFLRTNIDYKSNLHYYIFLPDFFNYIEESNESNNQKSYLVKKCTNPNNDTLLLTGNLNQPIYFGKTKIEIKDANTSQPNTLIIAPQINGLPNFSAGQNNISLLVGTCVNPEPGYIPGGSVSTLGSSLKVMKSNKEKSLRVNTKGEKILSASLWDGSKRLKVLEVGKIQTNGEIEFDLKELNLSPEKSYSVIIETTNGKNLIEYLTK
jgi:hypothetical protein